MALYIDGSNDASKLDDYEEGTWTPGITWSGGTSVAGTSNYGYYVKVGCLVGVYATIQWTSFNASPTASYARITGLPYTYKNATAYRSSALLGAQLTGLDGGTSGNFVMGVGSDAGNAFAYITPVNLADNSGGNYSHFPTILSTGTIFGFKLEYMTNT